MKFAFGAALIAGAQSHEALTEHDHQFLDFVQLYGRSYPTKAEYDFRSHIFKQRVAEHKRHNASGALSTQGVNHLTDWTDDEINK